MHPWDRGPRARPRPNCRLRAPHVTAQRLTRAALPLIRSNCRGPGRDQAPARRRPGDRFATAAVLPIKVDPNCHPSPVGRSRVQRLVLPTGARRHVARRPAGRGRVRQAGPLLPERRREPRGVIRQARPPGLVPLEAGASVRSQSYDRSVNSQIASSTSGVDGQDHAGARSASSDFLKYQECPPELTCPDHVGAVQCHR